MAEHTPGPWTLAAERFGIAICGKRHHAEGESVIATVWTETPQRIPHADALANARLVAAAPDLLEACFAILSPGAFESAATTAALYDLVLAAVAKATGMSDSERDRLASSGGFVGEALS